MDKEGASSKKIIYVWNGPKGFIWVKKGPKWSKTLGLTVLVPFKPFWTFLERIQNTKTGPKSKNIIAFCGHPLVKKTSMATNSNWRFRLALKTTDVNWFKEKDLDIVHSRYADKQFKFVNPGHILWSCLPWLHWWSKWSLSGRLQSVSFRLSKKWNPTFRWAQLQWLCWCSSCLQRPWMNSLR